MPVCWWERPRPQLPYTIGIHYHMPCNRYADGGTHQHQIRPYHHCVEAAMSYRGICTKYRHFDMVRCDVNYIGRRYLFEQHSFDYRRSRRRLLPSFKRCCFIWWSMATDISHFICLINTCHSTQTWRQDNCFLRAMYSRPEILSYRSMRSSI